MVHLTSLTSVAILSLASLAASAPSNKKPFFYNGFDLSSLKIIEDGGAVFKDTARGNATRPVEDILGDAGMNTVRLRLWVDPTVPYDGGYYETYDLDYTLGLAKRFSDKGYKIYLDYRKLPKTNHPPYSPTHSLTTPSTQTSATTGRTRKNNGSPPPGPRPSNPSRPPCAPTSPRPCKPSTPPASTSPSSASATKSATA